MIPLSSFQVAVGLCLNASQPLSGIGKQYDGDKGRDIPFATASINHYADHHRSAHLSPPRSKLIAIRRLAKMGITDPLFGFLRLRSLLLNIHCFPGIFGIFFS